MAPIASTLALGAGCYWGTEKFIINDFQKIHPGSIVDAKVGFMSANENAKANPSYEQVCTGKTGHVEVLNIKLRPNSDDDSADGTTDPEIFESLMRFFFMFHDPTTLNRQGNDAGSQYASVIFCSDEAQRKIATRVKKELQDGIDGRKVTTYEKPTVETEINDYTEFFPARDSHQNYLGKNPSGYCNHRIRLRDWPKL